jgi:NAD(P)H-hydrate epimerase
VPRLTRIVEAEIPQALPRRPRSSNKGDFGRVLIVGSGIGMPGAARLAGEACLRVGAGLVTVAVAPENVASIAAGRPELICVGVSAVAALDEPLERADVIAVGPGLGRSAWARSALQAVLATANKPLVIDADALNLLAEAGNAARSDWILTPHPGEAGRLLDVSAQEIQRDRLAALDRLIERYAGTVVLKGAGTLVGGAGRIPGLCERGNPGMATAGTGDVLTGCGARRGAGARHGRRCCGARRWRARRARQRPDARAASLRQPVMQRCTPIPPPRRIPRTSAGNWRAPAPPAATGSRSFT